MTEYFTISREISAPRERVFDVLTQPESFAVWFGTRDVDVPAETLHMDVRPGGAWSAVMHLPGGQTIPWEGEYTRVERPTRLDMTMNDDPARPAGVPVEFDLVDTGEGTTLTIRQARGDFSDDQVVATVEGYNRFIDDIAELSR